MDRRVIVVALALLHLCASPALGRMGIMTVGGFGQTSGSIYIGINFRGTSAYVTDGTGETYCLGYGDVYPVSRGGYTFGWETNDIYVDRRDRSTSTDRRLAGQNQKSNSGTEQATFRLDLPSTGTYSVRLAMGDENFSQGYQYAELIDSTTTFATIADTNGTSAGQFTDATGVTRTSAADWVSNNASVSRTFSSTIFRIKIGSPSAQSDQSTIAHVSVSQ